MRPEDRPGVERLLGEVFSPRVASRAGWKFFEPPVRPAPLGAVAETSGGELVACYLFVPREFVLGGARRLAVLAADLAVRAAYRTGGFLHRQVGELAEAEARRAGAAFAYGFPTREALPVARRWFGAREWAVLEAWNCRLRPPVSALVRRAWMRLAAAPVGADAVPPAGLPPREAEGSRDGAFLAWRFGDRRCYRFRVGRGPELAYLALAPAAVSRDLLVVDFAPAAEAALEALLRAELAAGRRRGVERLWVFCLPGSPMAHAAARLGFARVPERDKPVTVKPLQGEPPAVPAHLTIADADDP